jgi:hypothetical protein
MPVVDLFQAINIPEVGPTVSVLPTVNIVPAAYLILYRRRGPPEPNVS